MPDWRRPNEALPALICCSGDESGPRRDLYEVRRETFVCSCGGLLEMKAWKAFVLALILVAVIGAVCVAILIHRGFRATTEPSAIEAVVARTVRDLAIPRRARDEKNPLSGTFQEFQQGREDFIARCASCHGEDGAGSTKVGQQFIPSSAESSLASNAEPRRWRDSLHYSERRGAYGNACLGTAAPRGGRRRLETCSLHS